MNPACFRRSIVVPALIVLCGCGRAGADQADPALTPEQLKQEEEKAGMDPARLIPLAQRARAEDARRLLHRAMQALTERVDLSAKDRERLARLFASSLEKAARSPDDVAEIMGPKSRPIVVRQVVNRLCRERWLYETPLRLAVTVDSTRGRDPQVSGVAVWRAP
jgi:hypothetical protein